MSYDKMTKNVKKS